MPTSSDMSKQGSVLADAQPHELQMTTETSSQPKVRWTMDGGGTTPGRGARGRPAASPPVASGMELRSVASLTAARAAARRFIRATSSSSMPSTIARSSSCASCCREPRNRGTRWTTADSSPDGVTHLPGSRRVRRASRNAARSALSPALGALPEKLRCTVLSDARHCSVEFCTRREEGGGGQTAAEHHHRDPHKVARVAQVL